MSRASRLLLLLQAVITDVLHRRLQGRSELPRRRLVGHHSGEEEMRSSPRRNLTEPKWCDGDHKQGIDARHEVHPVPICSKFDVVGD